MDEEIIRYVKSRSFSESSASKLENLILSNSDETILSLIDKRCSVQDPSQAISDYVRALFLLLGKSAREDHSSRSSKLLLLVVLKCLALFQSERIQVDKKCTDCIDLFMQELDSLPKRSLPSITEMIISNFEHIVGPDGGYELQLLPQVLKFLNSTEEVNVEEGTSTGTEYAAAVIERILQSKWSKVALRKVVSIAKEMQLEKRQAEEFLNKIFECSKLADPQDIPSIVYQLLVYASKSSNRRLVLEGVARLFEVLDLDYSASEGRKSRIEILRQIEGTVLLHMNFAMKHDPLLGQELLHAFRGHNMPLTPFTVSALFSVGRIPRFQEGSLLFVKNAMVKSYQDFKHARECWWIPSSLKEQCLHFAKSVEKALLLSVQHSNFGREHVIPIIVKTGFALIEFTDSAKSSVELPEIGGLMGCKELGIQIVQTTFELHEMARNEIIEQSKIHIISQKPQQSLLVIRLLDQLVQNYPHLMLEYVARLKECLDYFTFLSPLSASSLIKAICPLFQTSHDLQNYTIMVLRKSMFAREESSRLAATRAIIDLIMSEKKSWNSNLDSFPSSSQASCSQPTKLTCGMGLNLFQELKGLLRRCLSQKAHIKEIMYRGLVNLVIVDPTSSGAVYDLLWSHFLHFCSPEENGNVRLKLGDCVKLRNGIVSLEEPLDSLLSCIHQLLLLQPQSKSTEYSWMCLGFSLSQENEVGVPADESFAAAFMNIRKSLRSCNLEDYNLNKIQDLSLETPEEEKIVEQARIFCGILEVLLDAAVLDTKHSTDDTYEEAKSEFESLLQIYDSIDQLVSRKQGLCRRRSTKSSTDFKVHNQEIAAHPSLRRSPNSVSSLFAQVRIPFLSTSSIAYLLEVVLKLIKGSRQSQTTSQQRSQGTTWKQASYPFKLASFALRTLMRYLRAFSSDLLAHSEHPKLLKRFVDDDIRLLAASLWRLLTSLESVSTQSLTQEKGRNKEGRGQKLFDESAEGVLNMTVVCVDLLCKYVSAKDCLSSVLEEILMVPTNDDEIMQNMERETDVDASNGTEKLETRLIHFFLLKKLAPVMRQFLTLNHAREFEVLSGTVLFFGSRLPPVLRKIHGSLIDNACKTTKTLHNGAARTLTTLAVQLNVPPRDLTIGHEMASELLKVTGSEEKDPIDQSDVYCVINASTKNTVATVLLQLAEATLFDVEWFISKLKAGPPAAAAKSLDGATEDKRDETLSRSFLEDTLHRRVDSLVRMVSFFAEMTLEKSSAEHFLRVCIRLYKALASLTKLAIAPRGYTQTLPSSKFQSLVEFTCKNLTTPLYNFVAVMQRDQQENSQIKGIVNQIKRECKTIPNLIFHVEDYEKYLIQLSKITKVNFMRHAKRSTARDFKILNVRKKSGKEGEDLPNEENNCATPIMDKESENDGKEGEGEEASASPRDEESAEVTISESDGDADSPVKVNSVRKRKRTEVIRDSDSEE